MATVAQKETKPETTSDSGPSIEVPAGVEIRKKSNRRPLIFGLLGVVLLVGVVMGIRFMIWSSGHVGTDDATIQSDVVLIAPQVTGNVTQVLVNENQHVKKGDLLVVLDPSSFETAARQAKANLDLAIAEAQGAAATVEVTKGSSNAQVMQAQGVVSQSASGIFSAYSDVAKAKASVAQAQAQASGAEANVYGAKAAIAIAEANKQKALDAVAGAQAQLDTSRAAVKTAQANVEAAIATADNADKQAIRNETLFKQGAVSGQVSDQARAAAEVAKAQVSAAQQELEQAKQVVVQRQSDLRSAKNQLPAADASVAQSRALLTTSQDQALAAKDSVSQYRAQIQSATAEVSQAQGKSTQATGQLNQANTAPNQVLVSKSAQAQAEAKVEQARAALRDAQINLDRCHIVAPVSGRISKNTVEVGNLVQPGGAMMSIVPDEDPWVIANFKETQLADVRTGQPVDIDVDAFPSHSFKGHVDSISAGTGSTFALLPPDNATGNFTKVVQRVSVKIRFEHGEPDMDRLRTGMSVIATITTKK